MVAQHPGMAGRSDEFELSGLMMRFAAFTHKWTGLAVVFGLCGVLSGCDTLPQPAGAAPQQAHASIAALPGVSPSGVTIAFVSLAGAPDNVRQKLGEAMTAQVASRQLALADTQTAHYLIRGSISAFSEAKATRIAVVWDIYDSTKRFRHRLQDTVLIPAVAQDGWSLVDAKVADEIAARSVGELSAYLSNTPEAIAASRSFAGANGAVASAATPIPASTAIVETSTSGQAASAIGYAPLR